MSKLDRFREQNPAYADVPDDELASALYLKFYSDKPPMVFAKEIGLASDMKLPFLRRAAEGGRTMEFKQPEPSVGGKTIGAVRSGMQGLTFGAADEIVAGGTALGRKMLQGDERALGDIYSQELERERSRIGQFRETNPALAIGSEIAGSVAVPLGAAKTALGAAGIGAGSGAAYGFLGSEGGMQERATGAATGGILGALLGAGLQAGAKQIGGAFEDYMTRRAAKAVAEGADSVAALRSEANAAYEAARSSGVAIDKAAFSKMLDDTIASVAGGAGRAVREKQIPKSADVLSAMKEYAGKSVGIDDLEYFRQMAQAPAGLVTDKAEQRAASLIIKGIDDMIEGLGPNDIAINPNAAAGAFDKLSEARDLWSRMRKSEKISNIINTASDGGYAGGFEAGLKTQIGAILRNPKQRRGFSSEEIGLLSQIQRGTPVGNILAGVSRMGISLSGGRTPPLGGPALGSGLLGLTTGVATANPLLGALVAGGELAATTALRKVREMSLEKQARLYADVLASGKAAEVAKSYPGLMRYLEAVATKATTAGAAQTPYDILNR